MTRIGLVVNPVAGLGGRVGLKGSDGAEVQAMARELGAQPGASARAAIALRELAARSTEFSLLTVGGSMGAEAARVAGVDADPVFDAPSTATTTPADTAAAITALCAAGSDLLLFAGGDGTARDVLDALRGADAQQPPPVVGIPAGVKMHSAVFAVNPRAAGEVAAAFARGGARGTRAAEVMDRDEEAHRAGRVSARLHGWLSVPDLPSRIQQRKAGTTTSDPSSVRGIAAELAERLRGGTLVLGPGSTTRAVATALGAPGVSLTGVNVLRLNGGSAEVEQRDARADHLDRLDRLDRMDQLPGLWIALSPIGGQGFLLGRGNQQITPRLLRSAGRERLLILCTESKLAVLSGRPLLLDTGDEALDAELSGYAPVITGYRSTAMLRLSL